MIAVVVGVACSAAAQTNTFPSSGNVGIGTTSPQVPLQIRVGTDQNFFFDSNQGESRISIVNDALNANPAIQFQASAYSFYGTSGAGPYLNVTSSGDVGIGLPNPSQALEVVGNVRADGGFMAYGNGQLQVQFYNGGDPTNQHFTELIAQNGTFTGRFVNDAYSQANNWLYVTRNPGTYSTQYVTFPSGNVGIGTTDPAYPLSVNGTIEAKEVIVQTGWSDYVFDKGYRLEPMSEVEKTIEAEKHLPGMPSAKEVAAHGVSVGEMEAKLLAQLEEVTLRQIDEEKRIATLEAENLALKRQLAAERNSIAQP